VTTFGRNGIAEVTAARGTPHGVGTAWPASLDADHAFGRRHEQQEGGPPLNEREQASSLRRLSRAACALTLATGLILGGSGAAVHAEDDPNVVNAAIDSSRAKLANLSAKSQAAVLALQKTRADLATAQSALAAAESVAIAAEARKVQLDGELVVARREEAAGQARIEEIKASQVKNEDIRDNIAREAYEGGGLEMFAAVLNANGAQDLADNMYVVERVNDSQNALLDELAKSKAAADAEQVKLEATRRRAASLALQAQAALAEAKAARDTAAATKVTLASLEKNQTAQVAAVNAQRAEEQSRLDALKAESARLEAELAARARANSGYSNTPPVQGNGTFNLPVSGPFTSEFEWRINPVLGYSELHTGLDIGAPCGAPVYAAGAGTIIRAAWTGGYGNEIVIDHGGGIATTYNHMSEYVLTSGYVIKGTLIGRVGTTGLSTGCHMHWEVRVNGTPVNPRGWF